MSSELQTISAAFELAKLAREGVLFLKKIKNADRLVAEVCERIIRLRQVLSGVDAILTARDDRGVEYADPDELATVARINVSVKGCIKILEEIKSRVGGFDIDDIEKESLDHEQQKSKVGLRDRVTFAFKEPGTRKRQTDLDARITALQTDLVLLQLWDNRHGHLTLGSNQRKMLATLVSLEHRIEDAKDVLSRIHDEQRRRSTEETLDSHDEEDAVESLSSGLRIAENIHERFTSEYQPDDVSIRFKRGVNLEEDDAPTPTPGRRRLSPEQSTEQLSPPQTLSDETQTDHNNDVQTDDYENEPVIPLLEMLDSFIDGYVERSRKERDAGHLNQAEFNLRKAIGYSQMRERHYSVPFSNHHELQEEIAYLYQKQCKWGEAVTIVRELLREGDDHGSTRQNQLLASIYLDRHQHEAGSLAHTTKDIESAEKHAMLAFNVRRTRMRESTPTEDQLERFSECVSLLVRILEAQSKDVEASRYKKLLPDPEPFSTASLHRRSTVSSTRPNLNDLAPTDTRQSLITAIKESDLEAVHTILSEDAVEAHRPCQFGKMPLMYAVEHSDESTVHKLLDPEVGADVNAATRKGTTALHRAAELGLHDMVLCLIQHDADKEAKDSIGETPLMKAVQKEQSIVVQVLVDHGADIYTKNSEEWSLLHHSIYHSDVEMTDLLLELGPELRHAVDKAGKTALHYCAERELVDQAMALVTHKNHADVNAIDSVRRYPLYFAASHPPTPRRELLVRLLVSNGARLDESRLPPKYLDYSLLIPHRRGRRALSRNDSISTDGSIGTVSTNTSRLSRILSGRMHLR